jgi:hypothetical protein
MILGCTPSVFWAKKAVRTVERGNQAMRDDGKEPGAPQMKLLAACQKVLENVEAAEEGEDEEDEDEDEEVYDDEEEEEDNEEGGAVDEKCVENGAYEEERLVWTPEDGWLDGRGSFGWTLKNGWSDGVPDRIERGERVMASIEPASANAPMPDRLAIQEDARSSGVTTSPASRTASADVPTLQERLVKLRRLVITDGDFSLKFLNDPMVGELLGEAQELANGGKVEQADRACDKVIAYLTNAA